MAKILIIDCREIEELLRRLLSPHELVFCDEPDFTKWMVNLCRDRVDLVLCPVDADFPNVFRALVEAAKGCVPPPSVLAVLPKPDLDIVAALHNMGVSGYLNLPIIVGVWQSTIERALCGRSYQHPDKSEIPRLSTDLIGYSPKILETFRVLANVIDLTGPSLFLGEPGTGRQFAAERLHGVSPRGSQRFVVVNCAGLKALQQENRLFGHQGGALPWSAIWFGHEADGLPWSSRQDPGSILQAQGGTLFLGEVDELDLAVQERLLRVVEEGSMRPTGGGSLLALDVRLIASATSEIHKKVSMGAFRQDLYWLLSRAQVEFPPLRERVCDIEPLADHFLSLLPAKKEKLIVSQQAIMALQRYHFPGNVQELRCLIERAAVRCEGSIIELSLFPAQIRKLAD